MASVKALFSIVRPGPSGKSEEIKPGETFTSVNAELADLKRLNAVSVISEDDAVEGDDAPVAKKAAKKAAADKSELV